MCHTARANIGLVYPATLMMVDSTNFYVKWANFQSDMGVSLKVLRKDTDFSDVTLVCEDGQQIEAQRFYFSNGKLFFSKLVENQQQARPLGWPRGEVKLTRSV